MSIPESRLGKQRRGFKFPPELPPTREPKALEESSAETLYISLLKSAHSVDGDDLDNESPFVTAKREVNNVYVEREERESQDVYIISDEHNMNSKSYDMGLLTEEDKKLVNAHTVRHFNTEPKQQHRLRPRKGSYKKKAVNERICSFLNSFDEMYGIGYAVSKQELKYWIQKLNLANDRVTVQQYLQRFVMHGYFSVSHGKFKFVSKQPKQPTIAEILNVKKQIMSLRASTRRAPKRKSY